MSEVLHQDTSVTFTQLARDISNENVTAFRLRNVTIIEGHDVDMRFLKTLRGHPSLEEFSMVSVKIKEAIDHLDLELEMLLVSCPVCHSNFAHRKY